MFKKCLIVAVAVAIASASTVNAADSKAYRVANNSAAAAKQLDLTFAGTGGSLLMIVYGQDNPCPDGTVSVNQPGGNATVTYPDDCVRVKGLVLIKASTNNGPISISSGFWTDALNNQSPILLTDAVQITVPTVSQWGLIVMTIALLIAATIIFARRKSVVTA
ncbi:MAG: IPTL-CTERM sorting domain-containing protein [Planctomycetota bacterium]